MAISSHIQNSFTDSYDEFLFACSHGDYLTVEHFLRTNIINQNDISRPRGEAKFSPIIIAIEHNQVEIIKILLDHLPYNDFREALLLAIYLDLTNIAQLIMEHVTFKCFYGTFADWQTDTVDTFDESHFGSIRPIQLAAQYNRTTILFNFLQRGKYSYCLYFVSNSLLLFFSGERIEVPHNIECNCNECKLGGLNDSLRYSQLRLSTYRGLSSDVYLALVYEDPITNAFNLSHQLLKLMKNEPNLSSEYLDLFNQVSNFSARLLDHIRNQVELELLLTNERLKSAIDHNQKEFITHTNTQQRLTDIWYHDINLGKSNTLKKRFLASIHYPLIFIPMYIGYFWLPCFYQKKCHWYFHQPAIQALIHTITYHIFILILILSGAIRSARIPLKTEYPKISEYYYRLLSINVENIDFEQNIISYLNIIVLIWMAGFVYRNIRQIIRQRHVLGTIDSTLTILFILYIIVFITGTIQIHLKWKFITNINHWKQFEKLHYENNSSDEYNEMKVKFTTFCHNYTFDYIDIPMIADGILTLSILFCIIHLCFIFLINEYIGPLLVSLITTSKTIYRWFIFILIFVSAYETSFLHLFSYYSTEKLSTITYLNQTINIRKKAQISRSFGSLKLVTINVFFSLFGITQNELSQTRTNITNATSNNSTQYYLLNSFTSVTGSFIYGSFAFFARIILITMIIAYIKHLYYFNKAQVLDDWKFARAKVYMLFISKDPDILPVPLNLIPTPRHIWKFFQKKNFSRKKSLEKNFSKKKYLRNLNYSFNDYSSKKYLTINDVMNCLVLRFLSKYHPFDMNSLKRMRQLQYKEELSNIRHYILDEIEIIQEANEVLHEQISTVFFDLDKH